MNKFIVSMLVLLSANSAFAKMIILDNETVCGKFNFVKPEDRISPSFKAYLALDRASKTFTQDLIDQATAKNTPIEIWITDSTFEGNENIAKMDIGSCYCITTPYAGGDSDLALGFEQISDIQPAECVQSAP